MKHLCDLESCMFCINGVCKEGWYTEDCSYRKAKDTIKNMAKQLEKAYQVIGTFIE